MNKRQLRTNILKLLHELSVELGTTYKVHDPSKPGPDLFVSLKVKRGPTERFAIELCADPRFARVLHAADKVIAHGDALKAHPVLGLPRLGARLRRMLKERNVGYLVLDGQANLRGHRLLVDRTFMDHGDRKPIAERVASSPFADKSSLVLRHLLREPTANFTIRGVAARLGISPGLASRVVSTLRDLGYITDVEGQSRLVGREELLNEWAAFYRRRAKAQQQHRFYMHARTVQSVMHSLATKLPPPDSHSPIWGLSFHAGASLVAPLAFFSEVHVIWPDSSAFDLESLASQLDIEPAREEANLIVVRPYYRTSWSYGLRTIKEWPVVSDLQLFLDLSIYPRRGKEQADRIRQHILAKSDSE